MDPNTLLDIFSGLNLPVMAALAVLAGILRVSKLNKALCIGIPLILGGVWGYLITLDEVDALAGSYAKFFSAVLLNGTGAVVIGRLAAPPIDKLFREDSATPSEPPKAA